MTMRIFARVQNSMVVELLSTDAAIATLFHPGLVWVDVSQQPMVKEGWAYDGTRFTAPALTPPDPLPPTLGDIQAQIDVLRAQVAALTKHP
jgi:hypothetical protein